MKNKQQTQERLIPVLTGNSEDEPNSGDTLTVNPRAYGEQAYLVTLR